MFILVIEDRDGNIEGEYTFDDDCMFSLGRSRQCEIILPSDNVSRKHAELFTRGGQLFIRDLGSSNGVLIEGKRIQGEESLGDVAQVSIGDFKLHIEKSVEGDPEEGESEVPSGIHLLGQNLGVAGRHYALDQTVNLVGRGRDCSTTIIDPSVSRVHAKFSWDASNILWIEDLKSANGSFVNGIRVERSAVSEGDTIRIGNVEFKLERSGPDSFMSMPRPEQTASGIRKVNSSDSKRWMLFTVGGIVTALSICAIVLLGPESDGEDETPQPISGAAAGSETAPEEAKEDLGPSRAELEAEGKAALKSRNWEEALDVFGNLLDKDPLSKEYKTAQQWAKLEQNNAKNFSDGAKYLDTKLYGDSMKAFRSVTSESAYNDEASKQIQVLLEKKTELAKKARKACRKRKYKDCERLYSMALSIDPTDKAIEKKRDRAKRKRR